jgi:lipid-binding SYLF domain-containing protein
VRLAQRRSSSPSTSSTSVDASYYTLTKNGLQPGVAVAGTKFWKDKELN